jgi:hypothetical protein
VTSAESKPELILERKNEFKTSVLLSTWERSIPMFLFSFQFTAISIELVVPIVLLLPDAVSVLPNVLTLAVFAGSEKGINDANRGHPKSGQQPAEETCDIPDKLPYALLHILIDEACRIHCPFSLIQCWRQSWRENHHHRRSTSMKSCE